MEPIIFDNPDFGKLNIYGTPDQPLFVVKEVCEVLGIKDYRHATDRLEDFEKGCGVLAHTPGGDQVMATVTEAGLYTLVLRSNKPAALPFRKWVVTEVLPTIRRTGTFGAPSASTGDLPIGDALKAGLAILTSILQQNQTLIEGLVAKKSKQLDAQAQEEMLTRKERTYQRNKRLAEEYAQLRSKGLNGTRALTTLAVRYNYSPSTIRVFITRAGFRLSDFGRVAAEEVEESEIAD